MAILMSIFKYVYLYVIYTQLMPFYSIGQAGDQQRYTNARGQIRVPIGYNMLDQIRVPLWYNMVAYVVASSSKAQPLKV